MQNIHSRLSLRYSIFYYLPVIVWFLFIWLMSSQEGSGWSGGITWEYYLERKGAHIFEYAVFAVLMWRVLRLWVRDTRECFFWTLVWVLWAGTIDEVHQTFVFGRDGSIADVGIDMIGGLIGGVFSWMFLRGKNKDKQREKIYEKRT